MGFVNVDVAVADIIAASGAIGSKEVSKNKSYGVITKILAVTPSAKTFTAAVTDIITKAAHGYVTGLKGQVSTTTTLPTGLSASTDYFVIKLTADTYSLATSLLLAQAGTAIDITDTGTGTHTFTPTTIAGASVKLQGSMDNSTWVDLPIKATGDATKSLAITAIANIFLCETDLCVNYIREYYTLTAGQLTISQISKVDLK